MKPRVKMQYRCVTDLRELADSDWRDLPDKLTFSDVWLPRFFEFRAVPVESGPRFVFDREAKS